MWTFFCAAGRKKRETQPTKLAQGKEGVMISRTKLVCERVVVSQQQQGKGQEQTRQFRGARSQGYNLRLNFDRCQLRSGLTDYTLSI